jgi:hypothetical protein
MRSRNTWVAVCSVCVTRRISKKTDNELIRVAKKNKWQMNGVNGCIEFLCPDCQKEGYSFE